MAGAAGVVEADGALAVLRGLVAKAPEPQAELLALVWGPRFDRAHAMALLGSDSGAAGCARQLARLADRYDRLPAREQQRLRQSLRGAAPMVEQSPACPASC